VVAVALEEIYGIYVNGKTPRAEKKVCEKCGK